MTSTEAPPAATSEFLDVKATATKLGISPNTLYRLTGDRLIPFHRIRGTSRIMFSPSDIAEIIETSAVRPLANRAS